MNKNLKIAIDVDNVLNNLNERTVELFNQTFAQNICLEDITSYNLFECLPYDQAESYIKLWESRELWRSLTPPKDAVFAMEELCRDYDVYVVTASRPQTFLWKYEWLLNWFPSIDPDRICCVQDKSLLDVDVIVDDCVEQLKSKVGWTRICFDQPWNRDVHDEVYGIHRAKDWNEILEAVYCIEDDYRFLDYANEEVAAPAC